MKKPSVLRLIAPALILLSTLSFSACGFKKLASKTSAQIFYDANPAIDREEDVELAQQSSLGFLKMLEGFYLQDPKDDQVLLMLTKAYAGYAYGFTENDILKYKDSNQAEYDKAVARAKRFYTRARDYGLQLLSLNSSFAKAKEGTLDQYKKSLQTFHKQDLEAMFWTAFAWGNYLNFNKDSVEAIAEMPRIELLMERVMELDENYNYGGPHLFLGAFYGSRPQMLGGDPAKAKANFEKAISLNEGKYLMAKVAYAQFYAVQVQDRALFQKLLQEVVLADAAILPEQRLSNEIAKIRAQILLSKQSSYFSQTDGKSVGKKKKK